MTELINISTLSQKINMPVGTIRKLCMKRQIPFVKFPNRTVRFNVSEVEKFIKARTVSAKAIGQ